MKTKDDDRDPAQFGHSNLDFPPFMEVLAGYRTSIVTNNISRNKQMKKIVQTFFWGVYNYGLPA